MDKKKQSKAANKIVGTNKNQGSGAFNEGSMHRDESNKVISVPDEEKRTGHRSDPGQPAKKNPRQE